MPHRKTPFHIVGIDHVVFLVDDMPKALAFYGDVLGCARGFSYPALGMEQVWAGASLIVFWDVTHPGAARAVPPVTGGRNVDHLALAVSPCDRDELRKHLADHGVAIETEAFQGGARGMGDALYIHDPFGNRIELKGPPVYPDGTAT